MGFELVSETNFVALLEEIKKEVEETKKKPIDMVKEEFQNLEKQVQNWISDHKIRKDDDDVFWGESFFSVLRGKLG